MMLVEEGKVRLDEPVDRLLPELADRRVLRRLDAEVEDTVPAKRPITVEDLLTFRCGLGMILGPPYRYPIQKANRPSRLLLAPKARFWELTGTISGQSLLAERIRGPALL